MPDTTLPLQAVHEITLRALTLYAADIEEMERDFSIQEEDIDLLHLLAPGKKLLDVGSGSGRYATRLVFTGMDYTGVDYSPAMVEQARRLNPGFNFDVMSFHKLDFEDDTFDCIWACHVFGFEPKAYLPAALAELRRVLKSGGIMVVVLPNRGESYEDMNEGVPILETFWFSSWLFEEFYQALEKAEFTVIHGGPRPYCGTMTFVVTK
ncbi:MAG: class I SAM-dependent methyltransferase [Patescibacteria group bacterium]